VQGAVADRMLVVSVRGPDIQALAAVAVHLDVDRAAVRPRRRSHQQCAESQCQHRDHASDHVGFSLPGAGVPRPARDTPPPVYLATRGARAWGPASCATAASVSGARTCRTSASGTSFGSVAWVRKVRSSLTALASLPFASALRALESCACNV